MTDKALIAEYVASAAQNAAPMLIEDTDLPEITNFQAAEAAINMVVKQSPLLRSERTLSGVLGILGLVLGSIAAALMVPEAKELVSPAAPIWAAMLSSVASGLAGVAAIVSKATDQRPTR